jgi:hypothetical protein
VKGRYIFIAVLFIVLMVLYLLFSKWNLGKITNLNQIIPNQLPVATSQGEIQNQSQETENITSNKISLAIVSPMDGDTLGSTNATVKGKTVASAEVFVNDVVGKADINGNFSINVALDEGENQIVVSANDANGNAAEQAINVVVTSF